MHWMDLLKSIFRWRQWSCSLLQKQVYLIGEYSKKEPDWIGIKKIVIWIQTSWFELVCCEWMVVSLVK
jgi:hypothetical protein